MKKNILFGIMILLSVGISACGNKAPSAGTYDKPKMVLKEELEQQNEDEQEQDENESDEQEQEQEQQNESETIYNIGDTANLKDWSITVNDMAILDNIVMDFGQYTPSSDNNKCLDIFVSVTNNGKSSNSFLSSFPMSDDVIAKVIYGDGYEFTASNLFGYDYDMHDSGINPLSSLTGEIVFSIPEVVANSTESLIIRFSCENEKVEFKIR